jgi:transposase
MSIPSPLMTVVNPVEEAVLRARARAGRGEPGDVVRARIMLAAVAGQPNQSIASRLGICVDTVRKWRRRFAERGLAGLEDRPRTGRPRRSARCCSPLRSRR